MNSPIIWKATIEAFPIIGKWIIWKVGKGDKVLNHLDPWIGSENHHIGYLYLSSMISDQKDIIPFNILQ
jgi:hypothetical protein